MTSVAKLYTMTSTSDSFAFRLSVPQRSSYTRKEMNPGTMSAANARTCCIVTLPVASKIFRNSVTHVHHAFASRG